jgi:NADH/NAD ratio-sensing transcriptional regulator Rex
MESIADATVTRLLIYKRILGNLARQGRDYLFSNELAALTDNKAALVRRDLMHVSVHGSAAHGYSIAELISGIDRMLGLPQKTAGCSRRCREYRQSPAQLFRRAAKSLSNHRRLR